MALPIFTVNAPIKDRASIQKLLFQPFTMVCFAKIHLFFTVHDCKKFSQNTPIFGNFLGVATIKSIRKLNLILKIMKPFHTFNYFLPPSTWTSLEKVVHHRCTSINHVIKGLFINDVASILQLFYPPLLPSLVIYHPFWPFTLRKTPVQPF